MANNNYGDLFKLVITVPDDAEINQVLNGYLVNKAYAYNYIINASQPNLRKIIFSNLNEANITHVKEQFRVMYSKSKYINFCSFHVLNNNEYID